MKVYPLSDYTEDMASKNDIIAQDPSFTKGACLELCNKVWDQNWH